MQAINFIEARANLQHTKGNKYKKQSQDNKKRIFFLDLLGIINSIPRTRRIEMGM
jgi:hypothetical protein